MNEIEVVVDVRQSPDTAELIVVKQKLAVEGGIRPVGGPTEQRLLGPSLSSIFEEGKVTVNRRARIAFDSLPEPERLRVLQAAWSLPGGDPAQWPADRVKALPTNGTTTYLLRVSPDLLAFVLPTDDGRIELLDLVRRETLELFREDEQAAEAQG